MGRMAGLAAILALALSVLPAAGQEPVWVRLDVVPSSAVPYDYDKDGVVEIVLPGAVIEGRTLVPSPYPPLPYVAKADLDGGGVLDLVLYGGGELQIYDGMTLLAAFKVPDVEPVKTRFAFAFGNSIVWRGKVYTVEGVWGVIPVADRESLYALYQRGGVLRLLNVLTGEEVGVYSGLTPLYGARSGDTFYVAARTQDGYLAVVKYELGKPPQVGAYAVKPEAVLGFNAEAAAFYVKAGGKLYKASATYLLLLSDWEPVSADEEAIYLWRAGTVAVFNISNEVAVLTARLPSTGKPSLVTGFPMLVAVIPGDGTYILYPATPITIVFSGAPWVVAGEPYRFSVSVSPKNVMYTVLVDGVPVPPNQTTVVFTKMGYHNITVQATDGVITVERTFTVYAAPRPLKVSLNVVSPPMAGALMEVVVLALDGGRHVILPVNLTLPSGRVVTWETNKSIAVPVGVPESPYYRVKVTVWGDMYGTLTYQYDIPVVPAPVEPVVSYLGDGSFRVDIVSSVDGKPVEGTLLVQHRGRVLYTGNPPAVFRLEPGDYALEVEFRPQNSYAYRDLRTAIALTYLGESGEVPDVAGTRVVAVDRVVNVTRTVTVTQPVTETVVEVKEVEVARKVLDTFEAMLVLWVGLAAGAAVGAGLGVQAARRGLTLPGLWKRREKREEGELFTEA